MNWGVVVQWPGPTAEDCRYRYYLYRYISTCIYRACTIPTPVMDKVLVVEEILKMYDHTRVVY